MTVLCVYLTLCAVLTLGGAASLNVSVISYPWSTCERQRHNSPPDIGAYVPQCDDDGNFRPLQCWASSGYCWCVNTKTGEEIPGTRTPPGTLPPDCEFHATTDKILHMNSFCAPGWSRFGMRCFTFISAPKMWIEAQGDQVYIYKSGTPYTLIEGYPKSLKEELGIEGQVNAAFACANRHMVHIIQGTKMFDVDLSATPRVVIRKNLLPISGIDAGLCGPEGVRVFKGSQYYRYPSPMILAMSKLAPMPLNITSAMIGCRD